MSVPQLSHDSSSDRGTRRDRLSRLLSIRVVYCTRLITTPSSSSASMNRSSSGPSWPARVVTADKLPSTVALATAAPSSAWVGHAWAIVLRLSMPLTTQAQSPGG